MLLCLYISRSADKEKRLRVPEEVTVVRIVVKCSTLQYCTVRGSVIV